MNHICIKAVNPDNEKELRSLAKLFSNVYGHNDSCPEKFFTTDFWKQHAGNSFVSLAAFSGDSLIGHLGLVKSRSIPGCMELIFPAFDVATLNDMYQIAESGFVTVQRLATRQNWNSLCCIPFAENVEYLPILTDVMGFGEVALLPKAEVDEAPASCTSVWYRSIRATADQERTIFVPESIEPAITALLTDLKVAGRMINTTPPPQPRPNLHIATRHQLCASNIVLETVATIEEATSGAPLTIGCTTDTIPGFFAVDLSSPIAIGKIQALLDHQYTFCGYVPDLQQNDTALFMNFSLPENFPEERFSKSGKILSFSMRTAEQSRVRALSRSQSTTNVFPFISVEESINEESTGL